MHACKIESHALMHACKIEGHLAPILLIALLMWLELLLRLHPLLLHEQVVLDALQLEQAQLALGVGGDGG